MSKLQLGTTAKRLDPVATQQGIALECPYREGLTVTILPAASFNPRFEKASRERWARIGLLKRAAKKDGESEPNGVASSDDYVSRNNDPEFVAKALVADMDGIYDGKKKVPYTHELGVEILSDPGHADVLDWIALESTTISRFYAEELQANAKN